MTDKKITLGDIDEALGVTEPSSRSTSLFRQVGFDEDDARRGAAMLESGMYFGFVDVATNLLEGGTITGARPVMPWERARFEAVADRPEAQPPARQPVHESGSWRDSDESLTDEERSEKLAAIDEALGLKRGEQ